LPKGARKLWLWLFLVALIAGSTGTAPAFADAAPPTPAAGAGTGLFSLDTDREAMAPLDGKWRFHPGDDPRWASPAFDDSGWALLDSSTPWSEQGYPGMGGYAWYRFRVVLPPGEKQYAIGLSAIMTGFEIYEDGQLIGSAGAIQPAVLPSTDFNFHAFPLPAGDPAHAKTVVVALRIWHAPLWASYEGGGPQQGGHVAGLANRVAAEARHAFGLHKLIFVDLYAYSIAAAMIAITIFGLYFFRPKETEYLWFAVVLLAQASDAALNILHQIYWVLPIPIFDLLDAIFIAVAQVGLMFFLTGVMRLPRNLLWKTLVAFAVLSPVFVTLYVPGWISVPASAILTVLFVLPSSLWMLAVLVRNAIRGELTARLLLLPVFAFEGLYVADNIVVALYQSGVQINPQLFESAWITAPFSVHPNVLANLIFLLAMLGFLIRRFTIAHLREERLEGTLEAARQVQRLLVPESTPAIPGFRVECVYRPAELVGGDFFQIVPLPDGELFLVIGDVAGKGLPAAMMVSMVLGSLRSEMAYSTNPAILLAAMNEQLVGRTLSALTTCLCATISQSGRMQIATAGHMAPYCNGVELELPGALPLGMISGAGYDLAEFQLKPDDRLVFLSDGVPEAGSKNGRMLGFDGTLALSSKPAEEIARTAIELGQEDDITVVTVELCPCPQGPTLTVASQP